MINSKELLKEYLNADKFSLGIMKSKPKLLGDYIWKFEISLRFCEYYTNIHKKSFIYLFHRFRYSRLSIKLGFQIPLNVFGKGLRINHFGLIIVNKNAIIGDFCDIHQGVNIGENFNKGCPVLGNDVWIGPGSKIFGNIHIGDRCIIGANSVVNKNFLNDVTIAGVPATVIKDTGNPYLRTEEFKKKKLL